MKFTIPQTLQHEYEALRERLRQATQAGGEVGDAAKTLARLMRSHFVKEYQIVLPLLGLLASPARSEWNAEMAEVLTLTERLEAELPQMLAEHQTIVAALKTLHEAAARAGRTEIVAFAEALAEHARTEEEVMYPAAVLVGQMVRQRLGQHAPVAAMHTPDFFDAVPAIVVADRLAETLGAAEGGLIEYRYIDAVKVTGHSCPTVAGAWLMTRAALARLYPGETPRRGEIRVELCQAIDEGVAGGIASVAGLITGAANEGGFKGLVGRFARNGLLRFGVPMRGEIRFTRLDNGRSVELTHRPQAVPPPAGLSELLRDAFAPQASTTARRAFAHAWQGWVQVILTEHADDPALIEMTA